MPEMRRRRGFTYSDGEGSDRGRGQTKAAGDQTPSREETSLDRMIKNEKFLHPVSPSQAQEESPAALIREEARRIGRAMDEQGEKSVRSYYNNVRYGFTALGAITGGISGAYQASNFSSSPEVIIGSGLVGAAATAYLVDKVAEEATMPLDDVTRHGVHGDISTIGRDVTEKWRKEQYKQKVDDSARRLGVPAPNIDSPGWGNFIKNEHVAIIEKYGFDDNYMRAFDLLMDISAGGAIHGVSEEDRHSPEYQQLLDAALTENWLKGND